MLYVFSVSLQIYLCLDNFRWWVSVGLDVLNVVASMNLRFNHGIKKVVGMVCYSPSSCIDNEVGYREEIPLSGSSRGLFGDFCSLMVFEIWSYCPSIAPIMIAVLSVLSIRKTLLGLYPIREIMVTVTR